jgi:hypothetical protein
MTLDDIPDLFPGPTAYALGAKPRCRRHDWVLRTHPIDGYRDECARCGAVHDLVAARRGRTNRSRGNALERWVCKLLGIERRGQYGGADDGGGSDDWIVVQVKSGGSYPERIDGLLRALPVRASQLRGVVHVETPGPGAKRRALITLDLYEFAAWYGGKEDAA